MLKEKYINQIKTIFNQFCSPETKLFIFGSSVESDSFHDVDVGVLDCCPDGKTLTKLHDALEKSTIPYKIDVVDFNQVEPDFKEKILKGKILWIT
ncbi:nucleotidyltransferase domain-containing protein [bacterium]|nr:nucleotidyltransferase domain-containing protein [bacterium]